MLAIPVLEKNRKLCYSKHGKIRDRGDAMAKSTVEYSQSDLPTMQVGLDAFGRTVANVQEYREAYVSL